MTPEKTLAARLESRTASVCVIGLGYVGLPLSMAIARAGFETVGFDIEVAKVEHLNGGRSYIDAVASDELTNHVTAGRFRATAQMGELAEADVILVCVPTPLTPQRNPDLSFVESTARSIRDHLRPSQLVVLESTTYPGTTEEIVRPILEESGLKSGKDFFLGYSPEREDPGNKTFDTAAIPKIVAGDGPAASRLAEDFYRQVVNSVVSVSTLRAAEAVKITENVFRAVNIALVNDLKLIYEAMGIDVWEVIDAAATKPFGYMPFYPGPGFGGHCIPVDPFYLAWKAREYGFSARFVELAGEINVAMPRYVVQKLEAELDRRQSVSLGASKILLLGLSYKKNTPDTRESPALELLELLRARNARTDYHDPLVPVIPPTRRHGWAAGRESVALSPDVVAGYNAVLVATDHDAVDYALIARHARLIIDTRNVFARHALAADSIVKA